MGRKTNCHPNPPPGSSPQAAAAAKKDAEKRDGGVMGALKTAYNKMMSSAPTPDANPQSRAVIADKKEQADKITPDAK
jgi:hypothetical protein